MKRLVITNYKSRIISMLFNENKESNIDIYNLEKESIIDNIYVGRVRDIAANIGAAFIETAPGFVCFFSLTDNRNPIFLNKKNTKKVCQGDLLLVQIKKEGTDTKAPVCSSKINLNGNLVSLTCENPSHVGISKKISGKSTCDRLRSLLLPYVNDTYGFIVRTKCQDAAENEILSEAISLCEEFMSMVNNAVTRKAFTLMKKSKSELIRDIETYKLTKDDEIVTDIEVLHNELSHSFSNTNVRLYKDDWELIKAYDIEGRLSKALDKKVWLRSGGYLIIEPTEALTVIDVNTGKIDQKAKNREDTFLKTNLDACKEIARQLILRNISGIIIIDFINISNQAYKDEVARTLKEYLKADNIKTNVLGYTSLDLMEITRKKIKRPLRDFINF